MAIDGLGLIRKHFRQRFGIAARKVAIRADVPLIWRALVWVLVLSTSAALGMWIYDAGMRIAGFDRRESAQVIERLNSELARLAVELEKLRSVARSSDSRIQVETTTQDTLTAQIRALQRENSALKEDVAVFEGLMSGAAQANGVRLARVTLEPVAKPPKLKFRVLIVNSGAAKGRESRGELRFELNVRQNGKDVTISVPSAGGDRAMFRFDVKHFQRVEGEIPIPGGADLKSGAVFLVQDDVVKARQALVF